MNYSKHTYYAHSMQIYGTDREKLERGILERMGFRILCPNNDLSLGDDMNKYLQIVARCKRVVCSEYSGFIGKGVYLELKWALRHNIPCYVLREDTIYRVIEVKVFNDQDWKTTYGHITKISEVEIEYNEKIPHSDKI